MFDPDIIKKIMADRGLGVVELATEAKISHTTLGNILRHDSDPQVSTIHKIAKALRVPASVILGEGDPKDFQPNYIFYLPKNELLDKDEITVVLKIR